ncbi:hypothetical protein [Rahnella sp. BCC 1045]|uniref:hypothetical protein n=1 Tax=Rahnella TaxID=34037 RepID=UPI00353020E1
MVQFMAAACTCPCGDTVRPEPASAPVIAKHDTGISRFTANLSGGEVDRRTVRYVAAYRT